MQTSGASHTSHLYDDDRYINSKIHAIYVLKHTMFVTFSRSCRITSHNLMTWSDWSLAGTMPSCTRSAPSWCALAAGRALSSSSSGSPQSSSQRPFSLVESCSRSGACCVYELFLVLHVYVHVCCLCYIEMVYLFPGS